MAEENIHQKLLELECPFTWDLSQYPINKVNFESQHDNKFIPELTFMKLVMAAYAKAVNFEYVEAEEKLQEAEQIVLELESSSKEVGKHIYDATKIHLLKKAGKWNDRMENVLKNIENIKVEMYERNLNEFKSCAWTVSNSFISSMDIATKFAKLAIHKDPNAATSHFLLAKNLRAKRRSISVYKIPEKDEVYHFKKAYELCKNPQFGLFVGQTLKESRDYKNSSEIFKEIYAMNIESALIQMRLALAFTQMNEFQFAEKCFDYVESVIPEDSMFLHYKGLFFMKKKQFEQAAEYLAKAGLHHNIGADMSYAQCMRMSGKRFDFPGYFIKLLEKYSDYENPRKQRISLHIGLSFYWIKRDIRQAIKYFLQAVEIDPDGEVLKYYVEPFSRRYLNIYRFLEEDLLPKVETYRESKIISLSDETIVATEKLQQHCEKYKARRISLRNLKKNMNTMSITSDISPAL